MICLRVFFFQAEDGIRDLTVTGVQTCALPISGPGRGPGTQPRGGAGARRRGPRPHPSIRQCRDDRRMVGGLRPLALVAIDLDGAAARGERGREQNMVDPEPPAAVEGAGAVVPPREETALLAVKPERVTESPRDQIAERRALRLTEHDLAAPLLRVPDVAVLRRDVEVAAEHDRRVGLGRGLEEGAEATVPVELVGVLVRADLLAVRPVDTQDREAGDTRH